MPRLPMIRVIGSQAISTSCPGCAALGRCSVVVMLYSSGSARRAWDRGSRQRGSGCRSRPPPRGGAAGKRLAVVPPLRLAVGGGVGDATHAPDEGAVRLAEHRG